MTRAQSESLVLAIDVGTSSTRTALFDDKARRLPGTGASEPYSVLYTPDGGAELSPVILRRAAACCCAKTLRALRASRLLQKKPIAAVAGSALWHALLGLDRQKRPITPIFTWGDSRATDDAARLRKIFSEKKIHARTGCMLRATFWPAKLSWLKQTHPGLFRRVVFWVSPVDWIFHELFGAFACSASMASATGLYNLQKKSWDKELTDACGIGVDRLPEISVRVQGTSHRHMELRDAQIFTSIGDGVASNLGSGADRQGIVAINVGTSAAVRMMQTNREAARTRLPFGLFRYVADSQRLLIGGAVSNAGNLRKWFLRELGLEEEQFERALSRREAAGDLLTVLPFWVRERAPTWPDKQFGVIEGLNQSIRAADIVRATATSVFYRLAQILELIESATGRSRRIVVSGGILRSGASIKLLADALGRDIRVAKESEASLRGAALHVLNQLGIKIEKTPATKLIKYNRLLAKKHRNRRQQQNDLETLLVRGRPGRGD